MKKSIITAILLILSLILSISSATVSPIAAQATDNVIFYDDFNYDNLSTYKVVQQSPGATIEVGEGRLHLNAANSKDSYIRIILPETVNGKNNISITVKGTFVGATDSGKWFSTMFNIQNEDFPYNQFCVRQNATVSNGTEFAERTTADTWNVRTKIPYSEPISPFKDYTMTVHMYNEQVITMINGRVLTNITDPTAHRNGRAGFQVRGLHASIDSVEVRETTSPLKSNCLTEVSLNENSNVILPPLTGATISTAAEYDALGVTNNPITAVFFTDGDGDVTDQNGSKLAELSDVSTKLDGKIIPAFRVTTEAAAENIAAFYKSRNLADAFIISESAEILKAAKSVNNTMICAYDATDKDASTQSELNFLRADANRADARIIIISSDELTRDGTEYLHRMLMTVWTEVPDGTPAALVSAVVTGVSGIIGPYDVNEKLSHIIDTFFPENTLLRMPQIIGHRGIPSEGQENTIASSRLAYELGATIIELDVYLTSDNVVVAMHDKTIDRTTNGTGNISSYTYEQLKQYNVTANASYPPEPIPKLEDYFDEFEGKDVSLFVEIKDTNPEIIAEVARLISLYDIEDQVNIIAFAKDMMALPKSTMPHISLGYLTSSINANESSYLDSLENVMCEIFTYEATYNPSFSKGPLGQKFISAALMRGVTVWPWTINNALDIDKYFMMGTFGITTNFTRTVSKYAKHINVEKEIKFDIDGIYEPTIEVINYDGSTSDGLVELVVIDGDAELTYENGKISADKSGTTHVVFRTLAQTSSGNQYYIYSEMVTVMVTDDKIDFQSSMQAYLNLESEVTMSVGYKIESMESINPYEHLDRFGLLIWNASDEPDANNAIYSNCSYIIEGAIYNAVLCRFETTTLGIAVKNLGDQLTFRVYYRNDDGSYSYSRIISNYSPKTYCYNQIQNNPNNAELTHLMTSILNYGSTAQLHFGHRTDDLMNASLSIDMKAIDWDGTLVRSDYSVPNGKDAAFVRDALVTSSGGYLNLEGKINYNYYAKINFTPTKATIYYWTEADVANLDVLALENATLSKPMTWNSTAERWEGKYEGQSAKQMFQTVYACMVFEDNAGSLIYSGVVGYSPERYAFINQNKGGTNAELAKYLAVYGDAARAFFANN